MEEDKDSLSFSLPPFHAISPLFLLLPLSSNLTDFGMKGSEWIVVEKGGDGILAVTRVCAAVILGYVCVEFYF